MVKKEKVNSKSLSFNIALFCLLLALFITIGIVAPYFLKFQYLVNVMLRNIIELGLMALPSTLIVITGGIDLSVGSLATLCAITGGMTYEATQSDLLAVIAVAVVGIVCGIFNATIITKVKISPLVATLATFYLFQGIARGITLGKSVYAFPTAKWFGNFILFGIPIQIYIYILFAVVFFLILSKTYFGKQLYSIGLNEHAAYYSGINTNKVKTGAYISSGIMCALASLIMLGRFSSIKYTGGDGMNLNVVTIIVLGGTSIIGGRGSMVGTIIATLIIAVLNSGLTVLNIPIDVQTIVQGAILLISLIVYAMIDNSKRKQKVNKC